MPTTQDRAAELHQQINDLRKELNGVFKEMAQMDVPDCALLRADASSVQLSQLFAESDELLLIHNMGKSCVYCTLWADGINGIWHHLANRCAFAFITPDEPAVTTEFANSRGWTMPTVCYADSGLAESLGFRADDASYMPGLSTFKKNADGSITRTAMSFFGPGDDFCALWHMLDLLPNGTNDWAPKYNYADSCGPACGCASA
jgi:predicted dithiol-disulfide oxidoreductase (DUF899 family)